MTDKFAQVRINEIFAELNLSELAKRRFAELSTGNKQRLAIARALLPAPPVLLLDEPTRSLDPLAADGMRELILSLKGVSVLLTSHNLAEVEVLCSRVAIISSGEIRAVGTPENLRRAHKQTQKVRIFLDNLQPADLQKLSNEFSIDFSVTNKNDFFTLEFTREAEDELLGKIIARLCQTGAKVLDIETEKATLLDVLESYE
jgi:ABC-2 type transport system ATP-binding protein